MYLGWSETASSMQEDLQLLVYVEGEGLVLDLLHDVWDVDSVAGVLVLGEQHPTRTSSIK